MLAHICAFFSAAANLHQVVSGYQIDEEQCQRSNEAWPIVLEGWGC